MDSGQVQTPMTETRPSTAGLIELHVYLVPEDLWNPKLNKVSLDVIWRFISLGFIRAPPDMKLRMLRDSLAEFLGEDAVTDKFVFLKCVGSSLAVVKSRQEYELKLKSFAPPYAREPELYLLPGFSNDGSTYGSTVTPDQHQFQTEYSASEKSEARVDAINEGKITIQPINENNPTVSQPVQDEGRSYLWNKKRPHIVPLTHQMQYQVQIDDSSILPLVNGNVSNVSKKSEVVSSEDTKKLSGRNPTGDSGIAESLLGVESEHSQWKRPEKPVKENPANRKSRDQNHQFGDTSFRHLAEPAHYQPPPSPPLLPDFPTIESPKSQIPSHDEAIVQQLNIIKEERIQLEKFREELIKRIKYLLEQHKLRRQQARDSWKKKYFETKKETSALEERLNKLKSEMDTYYQRILTQLAARDSKKRAKHPTLAANSKVSISITTKHHELDQLKRKVDNARIKLVVEIKMRKQASSDLNVLKAELAQKKAQAGLSSPRSLYAA
ncbi:LOW QUALITY PROTEIN: spermatogenesis-associated protein 1 [Bufo gargarizans]|uniref:LOW QUALITY PROTEIN: spermatogenesis-associated protein 1 n=1 Tax=Bufo gargarizans TaxID=30331 RepID=UPI001CF237F3|nr:LOW QUALITY PROTEIN: spermatogenesis-associated protein 1 [Bufo gargarizans]